MNINLQKISVVILGIILSVSSFALPTRADQPFMQRAKDNLQDARGYLNRATPDKGGHRNKAITLVNQAIAAVNSGIAYDRTHPGNRPRRNNSDDGEALESLSISDQPNMVNAREEIQKAINNLQNATADKGGHRNRALGLARDAIDQVNKGIEYDRTH